MPTISSVIPTAPIIADLFKRLALRVALDISELYTSLQTHIVDGQEIYPQLVLSSEVRSM